MPVLKNVIERQSHRHGRTIENDDDRKPVPSGRPYGRNEGQIEAQSRRDDHITRTIQANEVHPRTHMPDRQGDWPPTHLPQSPLCFSRASRCSSTNSSAYLTFGGTVITIA